MIARIYRQEGSGALANDEINTQKNRFKLTFRQSLSCRNIVGYN
jgi:hypothetical protein